ncbi:hypothetical protein Q3G72_021138 [Acer saccharum]|nr:hypothetical protein Q3G72_021138 [Acer saccharum]
MMKNKKKRTQWVVFGDEIEKEKMKKIENNKEEDANLSSDTTNQLETLMGNTKSSNSRLSTRTLSFTKKVNMEEVEQYISNSGLVSHISSIITDEEKQMVTVKGKFDSVLLICGLSKEFGCTVTTVSATDGESKMN